MRTEGEPAHTRVKLAPAIRLRSAHLRQAQVSAVILTTINEVDLSAALAFCGRPGLGTEWDDRWRPAIVSLFVKASALALGEFPIIGAQVDGENLVYDLIPDIAVPISHPCGEIRPVIRRPGSLSLAEIQSCLADFTCRSLTGRIRLDELVGAAFTITGDLARGGLVSIPTLNAPQSAMLSLHTINQRAVVVGGSVEIRPIIYLSLAYDHRIIDNCEAISFLNFIQDYTENPDRMFLGI